MPRMRAKDSFYSSETKQVAAGAEFDIESEPRAKDFERRGLAEFVESGVEEDATHPDAKAEPAHKSKAEPAPLNKDSISIDDSKAGEKLAHRGRRKGAAK